MVSSKELTQLSVTTAAVLISFGIGRTTQTSPDTYLIKGNQSFSTNSPSSGPKVEDEAEAAAAVEFTRRPFVTVDNSIEPEWLLDVPSSKQHFLMGLTDEERESLVQRFAAKKITYTHTASSESNIPQPLGLSYTRGKISPMLKGQKNDTELYSNIGERQEQEDNGENILYTNATAYEAHNDTSHGDITPDRVVESVKEAIAKIPSLFEGKMERACYSTR